VQFVVPDPDGSMSGGNVYNRGLLNGLRRLGVDVRVTDRTGTRSGGGICFVDSLYLEDLPRFAPCHLLAHYLPSLVEGRDALSEVERTALLAADGFVAPSATMAEALLRLAPEPRPVIVLPPAVEIPARVGALAKQEPPGGGTRRPVLVGNLVPGKGILPLLEALGDRDIGLVVVGSHDADPGYAAACRRAGSRAHLVGALSHDETLATMAESAFLVSASRMESFGLALAEARALGVPIVARRGGNVAAHVDEAAGGVLADSDEDLAAACVRLARDEAELRRRRALARARRPPSRSWMDAARELRARFAGAP
jgi:glycosyltransferase involved in cell wall biosynthesis